MSPKLKHYLPAIILFIFFASLYIYTAAPGVYDGDSGELAAAVNQLGLAHPTGFPLYILTGKLFTLIFPFKDVAFRLNVFSGVLTVLALVFVYLTLKNFGISELASIFSVTVMGFGKNTIWSNSGYVNVYAISLLFVSLLFYIFAKWRTSQRIKYLYFYGLTWGLSLGTHFLMITLVVPFIVMIWHTKKTGKFNLPRILSVVFVTTIPLIQYTYLFIAYHRNTIIKYGRISNFNDLMSYISQQDYLYKIFPNSVNFIGEFLKNISNLVGSETAWIFFILSLFGLFFIYKKERRLFLILLSIILLNLIILFNYGSASDFPIQFRYLFIVDLALTIGLSFVLNEIFKLLRFKSDLKIIFIIILVSATLIEFFYSYTYNNRRSNHIIEDYNQNILLGLKPNSILFAEEDPILGPLWYFQTLGQGNDIIVLSAGLLNDKWYIGEISKKYPELADMSVLNEKFGNNRMDAIIDKALSLNKNVYSTFAGWDQYSRANFNFVPVGLAYAVLNDTADELSILKSNKSIWENYTTRGLELNKNHDLTSGQFIKNYAIYANNIGVAYANSSDFKEAADFFQKSLDFFESDQTKNNLESVKNLIH